ncbi:MAG: hypothetical protein V1794_15945 [Candidatus Glassbacteria bacterium]
MTAQKKILKADSLKEMGIKVEKVEYGGMKFGKKIVKNVQVNDHPVDLGSREPEYDKEAQAADTPPPEENKPEIEQYHDGEGNLIGLKITCRCGEVIQLEFSRD